MTRRGALAAVGGMLGYLYGKPVAASQGQAMQLVLDSVEVIIVQYRGRRVTVSPTEILDALEGSPMPMMMPHYPNPSQFPRSK